MNQLLDSVGIALQAVWANKLRSFMTVLGNIVAVVRGNGLVDGHRDERLPAGLTMPRALRIEDRPHLRT